MLIRSKKRRVLAIGFTGLVVLIASAAIFLFTRNQDPYVSQPPPQLPDPPLKELAERRGVQIGSFASLKYLRERPYSDLLSSEFEYAIIDGEPNWKFEQHTLRPSRTDFDFADMDAVFEFADQNNMPVRVQHLLWGDEKWLPDWLKDGGYTREELLDIIQKHIATVGERYRGKVREYTVVNEAFSRELHTGGNTDWWGQQLGRDYIDQAFIWARQADPSAVLLLNDFGNETKGEISDRMFDYMVDAKSRGIPIDGLGMQMHISAKDAPSREEVSENMRRFAAVGFKVYITEFDVNMHDVEMSTSEKEQRQADIYRDMLGACIDVGPAVCPNFGFLGLIDRQSWYKQIGAVDAMPLMFRDDYTPKPAFYAVRSVLENKSGY